MDHDPYIDSLQLILRRPEFMQTLGCAYTLEVGEFDNGELARELEWGDIGELEGLA
jgi:hypothetical protein